MNILIRALSRFLLQVALVIAAFGSPAAWSQTAPLGLLVPDGTPSSHPLVTAWTDAAQEEGLRVDVITDSAFMSNGGAGYQGIILPDQVHVRAGQPLLDAIQNFVKAGGKAMLVFDFAAQDDAGFYPLSGASRLSQLAGIEYLMYSELGDRTTGLGPIVGTSSQMRRIAVPPGKSSVYTAPSTTTASFLAGGSTSLKQYNHGQQFKYKFVKRRGGQATRKPVISTRFTNAITTARVGGSTPAPSGTIEAISGYVYGYLTYPSYVTRGQYPGETIMSSPTHGLIAGINSYGTAGGKVLFVNTPLGYLKGATDGMLLHGFLSFFSSDLLRLASLSKQPDGVGGMTLNWHLDSAAALEPMQTLKNAGVWNKGPFSMDMTAGPDTVSFGDRLGFDLPNNPVAQQFLRDFVRQGHAVGSHGGWIHDYYGLNATEENQNVLTADRVHTFNDLLILNKSAIEQATGKKIREYSSPEGNNPRWALDWSEREGQVGYYYTGHTGMSPTRSYRDGVLRNLSMWAFPVVPFGTYATFEEFQDFGVPKADVIRWYTSLIDFNVATRSSRLIYAHPPGAVDWLDVLKNLMSYAQSKGKTFRWYTMPALADFMASRNLVKWSELGSGSGPRQFVASHPSSLASMTWLLPKSDYGQPLVNTGAANVTDGGSSWVVSASGGISLIFTSMHR
ncbi:polysaccharide deacetylase family protein [Massilia litorea]|uniref:NodB homology domain-containing protein n=1 Tax=Massilia litorea TaxID=2769491 RepID=A0A7L9TZP5_9BURK|nr:hypothetical protein [Massilia litorea]QOL48150.1 hypothetical protein LPB04_14225 [Massilia litorea]